MKEWYQKKFCIDSFIKLYYNNSILGNLARLWPTLNIGCRKALPIGGSSFSDIQGTCFPFSHKHSHIFEVADIIVDILFIA